jgi:hypothetical protein
MTPDKGSCLGSLFLGAALVLGTQKLEAGVSPLTGLTRLAVCSRLKWLLPVKEFHR